MTIDEKMPFFNEIACLIRDASHLPDVFVELGQCPDKTIRQIHIKTHYSPCGLLVMPLTYPDSIVSYFFSENSIVTFKQRNHRYYIDIAEEFSFGSVTAEQVVRSFLDSNPTLKKSALSLLTEGTND